MRVVNLGQLVRTAAHGVECEGARGEVRHRDAGQQVRGEQRLRERGKEPAHGGAQCETHGSVVHLLHSDVSPCGGHAPRRGRVLERGHGVDDVVGGDGLAVLPGGVRADRDGPHLAALVHRPRRSEVRHERVCRPHLHEAAEDQPHERLVGARARRDRGDGRWPANHALAVHHTAVGRDGGELAGGAARARRRGADLGDRDDECCNGEHRDERADNGAIAGSSDDALRIRRARARGRDHA